MTRTVTVTQEIEVKVDESKFTPEFLEAFKRHFFPLNDIDDHIKFIAESHARGIVGNFKSDFLEGYGRLDDFGISVKRTSQDSEINS